MSAPSGQNTVLAAQTSLTYLYSGPWNPSVLPTRAVQGTLFLGTGNIPGIGGQLWQKQNDGLTTDWTPIAGGAVTSVATTNLYVDNNRLDTYTPTGSISYPFKSIMDAVDEIFARGDNSLMHPYCVNVAAGTYTEDLNLSPQSGQSLQNVMFQGVGTPTQPYVYVQPVAPIDNVLEIVGDLDQYFVMGFSGFFFIGGNVLVQATNNGAAAFLDNGLNFFNCVFAGGTINFNNLIFVGCFGTEFESTSVTVTNCQVVFIDLQLQTPLALVWNALLPIPTGTTETLVILGNNEISAAITVGAGSVLSTQNCTIGAPVTINGQLQAFASYLNAAINVEATGVFQNYGSFFAPANLTVTAGGTVTNFGDVSCVTYIPGTPANWAGAAPTNPKQALDRLAAAVEGILGHAIP
jgi:hypothetical protein